MSFAGSFSSASQNGAGRAQIVEFFGTHLEGSISTGKCFAAAAKQLPVVNSSTSRFLQYFRTPAKKISVPLKENDFVLKKSRCRRINRR